MAQPTPRAAMVAAWALGVGVVAAGHATPEPLAGPQLRAAIVENTMYRTGRRFGIRWHWAGYYRTDGRAFARAWWGFGEMRAEGTWTVERDRWCQYWEQVDWSEGARNCFVVERTAAGLTWRHVEGPHAEDQRFEIRPGDPFGLAPAD